MSDLDALRARLTDHYLAQIVCDHERGLDNPICACSRVHLGWHPSVGAAVAAWVDHVMDDQVAAWVDQVLGAEVERLRELTQTCTCYDGNPDNYEGPQADCAVHGAIRAFNEASREIDQLRKAYHALGTDLATARMALAKANAARSDTTRGDR